jgi:hypothetical protein
MVKKKYVEEGGQIMQIPDEKAPEIIEVSYSKAKQLAKKPMSDKQQANIQRLVEINRAKWEAQKKIKDEQYKKLQSEKEQASTKVLVKPKRIYPPRTKQAPKHQPEYETDSDDVISFESDEEEEEVYQAQPKPKAKAKPSQPNRPPQAPTVPRPDIQAMKSKLEQLENQLKPQSNAYSGLASKFWKG